MSKKNKIIIFLILLTVLLLVLFYFLIQKNQTKTNEQSEIKINTPENFFNEKKKVEYNKVDIEKLLYSDKERLVNKAIRDNIPDLCDKLDSNMIDSCFLTLAVRNQDKNLCMKISDSNKKKDCTDGVDYNRVINNDVPISYCEYLNNKNLKKQCIQNKATDKKNIAICDDIKDDLKVYCEEIIFFNNTVSTKEFLCDSLTDEYYKTYCNVLKKNDYLYKDSDGDGIIDRKERTLGLDPFNSDTDGDGFSDFDELKNGYNPKE